MEFGRLPSVEGLDLRLPPEPTQNAAVLAASGAGPGGGGRVLLGTAGWSERGFLGVLYAPGTPSGRFLFEYARVFPTNELNSTWYGLDPARIERWAAAVPAGFRFCPKLPADVTHEGELDETEAAMERFVGALEGFRGRLGRAWGVLPPAFAPAEMPRLARFVERNGARVPLALELRHERWFADAGALDEACALFAAHGVALVQTDVAGRRDVLHLRLTLPELFLRFVGNHPHPSDGARLDEWAERIAAWLAAGLERAYVFLHQKHDPDAVALARRLNRRLAALTGEAPLPRLESQLPAAPARQGELF